MLILVEVVPKMILKNTIEYQRSKAIEKENEKDGLVSFLCLFPFNVRKRHLPNKIFGAEK